MLGRLRARLDARPDTEHEQGILRLIITALGFLYLLPDALAYHEIWPLGVMSVHFALALLIFLRIAYSTNISCALARGSLRARTRSTSRASCGW